MLRGARIFKTANLISRRSFMLKELDSGLKTTYDDVTDYGSYKHNIFTHRLPESSAQLSPLLVALHSRLNLPSSFKLSTLSQALNYTRTSGLANNFGLQTLGKNIASYYITEYLLMKYPRLPMGVHNVAYNSIIGNEILEEIGRSWGIESDLDDDIKKFLGEEPEFIKYGKLRYGRSQTSENGIYKLNSREIETLKNEDFITIQTDAYAAAVLSIIGGLYTHCGEVSTKKFIYDFFLSRKLHLDKMFQIEQPMRELVRLCDKLEFEYPLEVRLIAETGRLSASPIFVVGTFCGEQKLGEGVGSSLDEAKTRAAVNSLLSYYLYSPISPSGDQIKLPSDDDYVFEGEIGTGDIAI